MTFRQVLLLLMAFELVTFVAARTFFPGKLEAVSSCLIGGAP